MEKPSEYLLDYMHFLTQHSGDKIILKPKEHIDSASTYAFSLASSFNHTYYYEVVGYCEESSRFHRSLFLKVKKLSFNKTTKGTFLTTNSTEETIRCSYYEEVSAYDALKDLVKQDKAYRTRMDSWGQQERKDVKQGISWQKNLHNQKHNVKLKQYGKRF